MEDSRGTATHCSSLVPGLLNVCADNSWTSPAAVCTHQTFTWVSTRLHSDMASLPFSSLLLAWSFHSENKLMARKEESPDSTWIDLCRIWSSETCVGLFRRSLVVPCSYLECADLKIKLNLFLGLDVDSNQIQLSSQQWGSVILEEKGW